VEKLYDKHSKYQHIEVYGNEVGRSLVLDGKIQLITGDAHRYHEAMAVVPYLFTRFAKRVLILGGGDGYAAKTLLDYFPVEEVAIVDIDPEVIEVSKAFFEFPDDQRVKVINEDAWEFVNKDKGKWEMVLADYTDPSAPHAARLFTVDHFKAIEKCMTKYGVFSVQMVAPFFNPKAASCLVSTIAHAFPRKNALPYRIYLPFHHAAAQQGFCAAVPGAIQLQLPQGLRFINQYNIMSMFWLDGDEGYVEMPESTEENLLYAQLYRKPFDHNVKDWEVGFDAQT